MKKYLLVLFTGALLVFAGVTALDALRQYELAKPENAVLIAELELTRMEYCVRLDGESDAAWERASEDWLCKDLIETVKSNLSDAFVDWYKPGIRYHCYEIIDL